MRSALLQIGPILVLTSQQVQPATSTRTAAQQFNAPVVKTVLATTPQEVDLLLGGMSADKKILLMLNNNRPAQLTASLTVYTSEGVASTLPSITLDPDESRLIDFAAVLQAANIRTPLGFVRVKYQGLLMELGAQLTLYPVSSYNGLDSTRSLELDARSSHLDGVAWAKLSSRATVSLTNPTTVSQVVTLRANGLIEAFDITPNHTVTRTFAPPLSSTLRRPFSFDISYGGTPGAIRAFGFVENTGEDSVPIRFYDPDLATSKHLTAVGLEPTEDTHISLLNTTDKPVEVTPVLKSVNSTEQAEVAGETQTLGAHEAIELSISKEVKEYASQGGKGRFTLTVRTDAPQGALIGATDQREVRTGVMEDIPLRTSNKPQFMRGAYPLRWEQDYTTLR